MKDVNTIEHSLITNYRKKIYKPFVEAIRDFNLIEENDKVCVALSGGKDSLILAKLIQESIKHGPIKFEAEFINMDPGYDDYHKELILNNCKNLNIPIKVYPTDIFHVLDKHVEGNPCYLCARMRRGALYKIAKNLGCNKIALGHHFNDVIETTLLNILYSGNYKTMIPKLPSDNYEGLTLIRPLFYVHEIDIKRFMKSHDIIAMSCGCTVTRGEHDSKRKEIKNLIEELKKTNRDVELSIFNSAKNVNIDAVLGYKENNEYIDFNKIYEKRIKK